VTACGISGTPCAACQPGEACTAGSCTGNTLPGDGGYPASHLAPPLEIYGGDHLLLAPKVVTVSFPGDTSAATFEAFDDLITTTHWWDQVSQGYCQTGGACIGHGSGGGHVELTTPAAAAYTDTAYVDGGASSIKDLISQNVHSGVFPAPDSNTLYVIYFPSSSTITLTAGTQTAQGCTAFGGYHTHVPVTTPTGAVVDVAYAVIPQGLFCSLLGAPTYAASHEIIEAATDPYPGTTANGYYMDQTRDAWLAISAAEVGDVCALLMDFQAIAVSPPPNPSASVYVESTYNVQRSFSNVSVLAGHDPCVPTQGGPYFNVAPAVEKLVMSTVGQHQTIALTSV